MLLVRTNKFTHIQKTILEMANGADSEEMPYCIFCRVLSVNSALLWMLDIIGLISHKYRYEYEGKIVIIFLSISLNMCFECSTEPSH